VNWTIFIGHGVLAFSVLLMMACALTFKLMHKRNRRRAPLQGRKIGNLPGQQLLERIGRHDHEIESALSLMYVSLPLMFMIWLTLRVNWQQVRFGVNEIMFTVGAALVFVWGLRSYIKHYKAREKARDGWTAEHVTGLQLNRLVTQGCVVLHDLPADNFNIDHVVIAPRGVFAVETKSFRKPRYASEDRNDASHQVNYDGKALVFPDFATREPIEQASRQAQWLRRVLRDALEREVPVLPVVALPGWFVVRCEEGKRAAVQVFTPMGKGADFMTWDPERLSLDQRRLIAETLAARYPVIDA
jgi:hypothetical protein